MSDAPPPRKRFGVKAGLIISSLLIITLLVGITAYKTKQIADLQNALQRDWEITYNVDARPALLPESLDKNIREFLSENFDDTSPTATRFNRDLVYHDRIQFLFRGPIKNIAIYYPEGFDGDKLGKALRRFGKLESLVIIEGQASSDEWVKLCQHLNQMTSITHLTLNDHAVNDAVISRLKGHPSLESLVISYATITTECIQTIKSLPKLKELTIVQIESNSTLEDDEYTMNLKAAFRRQLPHLHINKTD